MSRCSELEDAMGAPALMAIFLPHGPRAAPFADDPQLRETAYEMVLRSLLLDPQDHVMLLNLVRL